MQEVTPQMLRAKQAAKRYGVGHTTIWLYARQGKITPHKISAKVTVFDVAELDKFFKVSA